MQRVLYLIFRLQKFIGNPSILLRVVQDRTIVLSNPKITSGQKSWSVDASLSLLFYILSLSLQTLSAGLMVGLLAKLTSNWDDVR